MRKILISILILLLIIMAGFTIVKGLSIGNFKILSAKQIMDENDKLIEKISEVEELINSKYPTKTENLNTGVSKLLTAEEEYLDLANVSTKSELNKASTVETYTVEFLWTRLGRHATAEGVNLSYTPSDADKSISFTVVGEYIPILSFVSAIENDSKLGFRIENFKLIPSDENLRATFTTKNVNIKKENVSKDVTIQTNENENKNENQQTTNETTQSEETQNETMQNENLTEIQNTTQNQTQAQ